jgi:hypothetical protein
VVDYSKYKVVNYFPYEPPTEYDRKYFIDEFNKISHAIDQFAQEYYPTKNASTKTGDYTATVLDDVLLCSGTVTITLYDAGGKTDARGTKQNAGRRITIKNIGTGQVTVDGAGSQTIDGDLTKIITERYVALELFSDGSNWYII